jgi:hypothetical protein
MSSSTVKRSSRTSLRNLISGGRKGKDKGTDGSGSVSVVSLSDSVVDDPSMLSSTTKPATTSMNGASSKHQQSSRDSLQSQRTPTAVVVTSENDNASSLPTPQRESGPITSLKNKEKTSRSGSATNSTESKTTTTNIETVVGPEPTTSQNRGRSAGTGGGGNVLQRLRERSRSRSRTRASTGAAGSKDGTGQNAPHNVKELLVAVTSCRSDGYYSQKAPGSISKLPRKAPTNLKLFHELAVGVKDAYAAVGATPRNPTDDEKKDLEKENVEAKVVLWDFVGNLDFVRQTIRSIP